MPIPIVDHGNHRVSGSLKATHYSRLALVHFHTRSAEQLRKKVVANWVGLGHKLELSAVRRMEKPYTGMHHLTHVLALLRGETLDSFVGRNFDPELHTCLLYTSPSPRDRQKSRMPSSA